MRRKSLCGSAPGVLTLAFRFWRMVVDDDHASRFRVDMSAVTWGRSFIRDGFWLS